jgi:hypothetical protein
LVPSGGEPFLLVVWASRSVWWVNINLGSPYFTPSSSRTIFQLSRYLSRELGAAWWRVFSALFLNRLRADSAKDYRREKSQTKHYK